MMVAMEMHKFSIIEGAVYIYTATMPKGCRGARYRVDCHAISVPTYQDVVVVKCLDGPDAGRTLVCTPAMFATRYKLDEDR